MQKMLSGAFIYIVFNKLWFLVQLSKVYQEIFCIFCWYYRIFVIKSLKDMYILFSKQHILTFPGKMGCSILRACVGEKT